MNSLPLQMLLEMFSNCAFSAYLVCINHISARNGVHLGGWGGGIFFSFENREANQGPFRL